MKRLGLLGLLLLAAGQKPIWAQASLPSADAPVVVHPLITAAGGRHPDLVYAEAVLQAEEHVHRRFWVQAEYLYFWTKNGRVPPLATTGSVFDARPGALDQPNTKVLFGGPVDFEERFGARFTTGWWFDDEHQRGVEANYVFLGRKRSDASFQTDGLTILARPILDADTNQADASLLGFPGLISGRIDIRATSRLDGFEVNLLRAGSHGESSRWHWLLGFRYLHLGEDLRIEEESMVDPGSPQLPGRRILVTDAFTTTNDIFGPQVGVKANFQRDRLGLQFTGKVLVGANSQQTHIRGQTTFDTNPATVHSAGLFAVRDNSGRHDSFQFAVVPEVGVNLHYQITPCWKAFVGYSFLYVSNVVRPGDQVSLNVPATQIPTSATFGRPGASSPFGLRDSDYWAHGLNFGLELKF